MTWTSQSNTALAEPPRREPKPLSSWPIPDAKKSFWSVVERGFESMLWSCRFAVLIPVIASLFISFGMFYCTTVDSFHHLEKVSRYGASSAMGQANGRTPVAAAADDDFHDGDSMHERVRNAMIANIVEAIDGYLLATVMLIFAFGLYELFISGIEIPEGRKRASKILLIHTLDDLKHRLGQVILLILIVRYFEHALRLDSKTPTSLLWLATGILLIAGALFLAHRAQSKAETDHETSPA